MLLIYSSWKMLVSPQAERNWESLSLVLEDVLESQSHRQLSALELGSGTGQHVIRFAQKLPFVTWQPSDIKEESLERSVVLTVSHSKHLEHQHVLPHSFYSL